MTPVLKTNSPTRISIRLFFSKILEGLFNKSEFFYKAKTFPNTGHKVGTSFFL